MFSEPDHGCVWKYGVNAAEDPGGWPIQIDTTDAGWCTWALLSACFKPAGLLGNGRLKLQSGRSRSPLRGQPETPVEETADQNVWQSVSEGKSRSSWSRESLSFASKSVWWLDFFHILGRITPTDELIFFRGVGIPPTRNYFSMKIQFRVPTDQMDQI